MGETVARAGKGAGGGAALGSPAAESLPREGERQGRGPECGKRPLNPGPALLKPSWGVRVH